MSLYEEIRDACVRAASNNLKNMGIPPIPDGYERIEQGELVPTGSMLIAADGRTWELFLRTGGIKSNPFEEFPFIKPIQPTE